MRLAKVNAIFTLSLPASCLKPRGPLRVGREDFISFRTLWLSRGGFVLGEAVWLGMGKVICSIAVPAPCLNLRLNGCFIKPFFPSCSRGLRMYALVLFIKRQVWHVV